jgi:uncharacterized protein (TIGR02266 family)
MGKRTPVTLKIKFKSETLEQFIERYAVDVSQGGIFIRTKEPLPVGTQMRFEFQLRDASPLIGGEGTVVWTRENDPTRPAIAPGMGVRFDRLAEGSQGVLERILTEKTKQAPQRPHSESAKPPLFTDTPTRVAPAPIQEQLLGAGAAGRRRADDAYSDQHTPLPKPMPFHTDADEFPDEAFEEATKVRALDELVAQTALAPGAAAAASELAARRRAPGPTAPPARPAYPDGDAAPGLPSPPEASAAAKGRLLDTSPSPRHEAPPPETSGRAASGLDAPLGGARTKLGLEAPRMQAPAAIGANLGAPGAPSGANAAIGPSGPALAPALSREPAFVGASGPREVASEPTSPVRAAAPRRGAGSAIAVLVLVVLAAAGAALWLFVLRDQARDSAIAGSGAAPAPGSASPAAPGSGSAALPGSGSSAVAAGTDPPATGSTTPTPAVDTVVDASVAKAQIEIVGTAQRGTAPFTAQLERGKTYKARVTAPGFQDVEVDVIGGGAKLNAALVPKPRVLAIKTDPEGAVISIDNVTSGKFTPKEIELTPVQAGRKTVRVRLFKNGYRLVEKTIPSDAFVEEANRMVATIDEKLAVAAAVRPPPPPPPAGSGSGSAAPTPPPPGGEGSAAPAGGGSGSAAPPAGPTPEPAEPEPDPSKSP